MRPRARAKNEQEGELQGGEAAGNARKSGGTGAFFLITPSHAYNTSNKHAVVFISILNVAAGQAMKFKEDKTMAMFKVLAASKFGPSGFRP